MRILQVHNQHRSRGGADEVVDHEAALLRQAGHEVEQFLLRPAGNGDGSAANAVKAVWNTQACADVGKTIEGFAPDIVHVHTPFPLLSPAIFRVAARHRTPAVTTVHSYRYSCIAGTCLRAGSPCEDCVGSTLKLPGVAHRCYHNSLAASSALTLSLATHRLLGTFSRHVHRFLTLTEFARRLLIRDGIPAERVVVKPNSVTDPGTPTPREGPPSYAAFAGRLVEEKGVRTLLNAWRAVGTRLPLRIAGDGPLRGLVESEARSNPAVEYVGWLDDAEITTFMAGADVVVVPSEWYEAQPLIILRAMALGRPLIVSDLENISETALTSGAGLTFLTGDSAALAATVTGGLKDLDTLRTMGVRGRRAYEARFTPQRSLQQLEQVYSDLQNVATP